MNNGNAPPQQRAQQGGSGAAPQQGQAQNGANLIRAEQVQKLPHLNDQQKKAYEDALRKLWGIVQSQPPDNEQAQQARSKLVEFSNNIRTNFKRWQQQQQAAQQQQQPSSQPGQSQSPPSQDSQGQQQAQQTPQQQAGVAQQAGANTQQGQSQLRLSNELRSHLQNFQYTLPPNISPESDAARQWLNEARTRYGQALQRMESMKQVLQSQQAQFQKEHSAGKQFTPEEQRELHEKRLQYQKAFNESKGYVDKFRQQQAEWKAQDQGQRPPSASKDQQPQAPQQQPQQMTQPPNMSVGASRGPPQPGVPAAAQNIAANGQQQPGQGSPATAANPNPAVETIKNQNGGTPRPVSPATTAQGQPAHPALDHQANGGQASPAPQPGYPNIPPPQQGQQQFPATVAGAAGAFPQGPPMSQQGQIPGGARPLSFQNAVAKARSGADDSGAGTPASVGFSNSQRESNNPPRMPIPKTINPSPLAPVGMPPARPTLSGGASNTGHGIMGQPSLQKTPAFQLEGDSERVLSKKKVDELIRQVTGGRQGVDGEALEADVEEIILQIADDFVDQVVSSACRVAKLRQSPTLEIRDIQLILERNYNIRVPGYASDEIRAVRKFAPSPGWSQKMGAVQAAKIAGGKVDI